MQAPYQLLPFRFRRRGDNLLLVNELGNFCFITQDELSSCIQGTLPPDSEVFSLLHSKDFICTAYTPDLVDAYAEKYRTKKKFLFTATHLHMMVMTHRCNQRCTYCHASACGEEQERQSDMSVETARRCVDVVFETPSPAVKIEFQGGEPSLNFAAIQEAVLHAEHLNTNAKKTLEFVICTNLFHLTAEQLAFYCAHRVSISTSLDGPQSLHDICRISGNGQPTYATVSDSIQRAREELGPDSVSALLTVTRHNLDALQSVIDEYIAQKMNSLFIRMLNPFGRAAESALGYAPDDFVAAYLDALDTIIELNTQGHFLVEEFAAILLGRILTPFSCGFIDIQSPAGAGVAGVIYETNGDVFVSDEARMHWMTTGDKHFCLGNVHHSNRSELYASEQLRNMLHASVLETLPGCAWCAYLPYCGSDPVRNFAQTRDMVSFKPYDTHCRVLMQVFDALFERILNGGEATQDVFWAWITRRRYEDVALRPGVL